MIARAEGESPGRDPLVGISRESVGNSRPMTLTAGITLRARRRTLERWLIEDPEMLARYVPDDVVDALVLPRVRELVRRFGLKKTKAEQRAESDLLRKGAPATLMRQNRWATRLPAMELHRWRTLFGNQ